MTRISTPCSRRWVAKLWRKRVHGDGLVEAGGLGRLAAGALHRARRNGTCWIGAGEQPVLRASALPIVAQDAEQLLGQHHIAIFAALALGGCG